MRSDTCPGERPVSQKPVTVVLRSRSRAKVAPAAKGGERPGGDACHRPDRARAPPRRALRELRDRAECGGREPGQHRPRTCPRADGTGTGGPKQQVSEEAPAPRSRAGHTAGSSPSAGSGTWGWLYTLPQKHPRPLPPAGSGQEGVKLESRNSPLRASPGPPLPPPPQRKGPRAAAPAGACHGLGAPRTPSLPRGTTEHPAPFPGPRHPWAPRIFPGALRILSRGIPQPFPGPEHPRGTPHLSPGPPHPQAPRAPSQDIPHSLPGPGHPHPCAPRTPTPAQGTPQPSPGHRRTPHPVAGGGWDSGEEPTLPPGVRSPGSGSAGVRDRGTPRGKKGCAE